MIFLCFDYIGRTVKNKKKEIVGKGKHYNIGEKDENLKSTRWCIAVMLAHRGFGSDYFLISNDY